MFSLDLLTKLTNISPRYGVDEVEAANIILSELIKVGVSFKEEPFTSSVPRITKTQLIVDGADVPCIGSSFKSGSITNKKDIHWSPHSDDISVVSFYDQPSVTISRININKVMSATSITGQVVVNKEQFTTKNILVGNHNNPDNIIFAHYDSIIGPGAVDNAAAVAIVVELIKSRPAVLSNNLFVIAGNEEISYDEYTDDKFTYDGHGYRVFESLHKDILQTTTQIVVIDGVGVSPPSFVQEDLELVLQFKQLADVKSKTYWLQNNQSLVLKHYHSLQDTVDHITPKYLTDALLSLSNRIS